MSDTEDEVSYNFYFGNEFEEEAKEEYEEEQRSIYDTNDFISGPFLTPQSKLPHNLLEFHHSFAYDCKRYFNLVVPEKNVLIYASGNLLNFYDVEEKRIWFRRSAFGQGIGHICKNPNPEYSHVAVAENGYNPPIIIYEWPTLEIVCLLKGGAKRRFSQVCYSPDGELFASQSGDPDYILTIWNWKKRRIMLKALSYVNDIYKLMFSPYVPGALTTGGIGHIKFWKMCRTFTGLKLKSQIGRFGKTEISDIIGLFSMPDEKVCSGCYWGNILIWDEGLITKEITRKKNKHCHLAPITQFEYGNGELTTIAMDGYVRIWYYGTIELANPPEEARFVAIEPNYEFLISESKQINTELMCLIKNKPTDLHDGCYFAQDGNGGILRTFISTELEEAHTERIFKCHAGAVVAIAACPFAPYICTFGKDGRIFFYQYLRKELLKTKQFPIEGRHMIWLPLSIEPTGSVILLGCEDGAVRVIVVSLTDMERGNDKSITLIQVVKPHNKPLNYMSINEAGTLLTTTGEDCTIFIFYLEHPVKSLVKLIPVGFVNTPGVGIYLTWKPDFPYTVLVTCDNGKFMEADLPRGPTLDTAETYLLRFPKFRTNQFISVKSQIIYDKAVQRIKKKKEDKIKRKMKEIEKIQEENPGITIDIDEYLADSESEESLPEIFIPPPNPIYFAMYTLNQTIWLSLGGYDAGYVYEYKIDSHGPIRTIELFDSESIGFCCYTTDLNQKFLVLGQTNGQIRISSYKPENFTDLNDYWRLSMHDNYNGIISNFTWSYDNKFLFSCGHDGNTFSYYFNPQYESKTTSPLTVDKLSSVKWKEVEDIEKKALSLEEQKKKVNYEERLKIAEAKKDKVLLELRGMATQFRKLILRNKQLLPSQQIPHESLLLDDRITADLENQLQAQVDLVKRKLEFEVKKAQIGYEKVWKYYIEPLDYYPFAVHCINGESFVRIIRHRKLDESFEYAKSILQKKFEEAENKKRKPKSDLTDHETLPDVKKTEIAMESFLMGLSPSTIEYRLTAKINRLLKQYRSRRALVQKRQEEWDELNKRKPIPGLNHPDDEVAIKEAALTVGDFKLKMSDDYKPCDDETTLSKYRDLLNTREKLFNEKCEFNEKVHGLRLEKIKLIETLKNMKKHLSDIHKEIPEVNQKLFPAIPTIDYEKEFPEKEFEIDKIDTGNRVSFRKDTFVEPPRKFLQTQDYIVMLLELHGSVADIEDDSFEEPGQIFRSIDEVDDTPWEAELRKVRLLKKLFEQDQIIQEAEHKIRMFDEDVEILIKERILLQRDRLFREHHVLTMVQELLILKKYEEIENFFSEKICDIEDELYEIYRNINSLKNSTEISQRNIEQSTEKIKEIQQTFNASVADNRFIDFLKRIFKRKYKPPKILSDETEESSSESDDESEDSEEDESITSEKLMIMKLDENICPVNLNPALYQQTYDLRDQRWKHEQRIIEEYKNIDIYKRDREILRKKAQVIENRRKDSKDELEKYQKEKQNLLNNVECLCVLKLHQIRNFKKDKKISSLQDSLLFSKLKVEALDRRIGELKEETLQQKTKHKKNKIHLHRMKNDIEYMEKEIVDLKAEIKKRMMIRFGSVINIEQLESAVLKRLIHNLRISMIDVQREFEKELSTWKQQLCIKQMELSEVVKENTEKLNLLTMLEEEQNKIKELFKFQETKKDEITSFSLKQFEDDLFKLTRIAKTQNFQIQALRDEINALKMKSCPLPKIENTQTDQKNIWDTNLKNKQPQLQQEINVDDVPEIISNIFKTGPPRLMKYNTELMRSLIAELIGLVYNEVKDQAKADKIIKDELFSVFENVDNITGENFTIIVNETVKRILTKLGKTENDELTDCLTDIISDILWEINHSSTEQKTYKIDTETKLDIMTTSVQLLREIVKNVIEQSRESLTNFEKILENIIIKCFELFPSQIIIKNETIEIIVEEINNNMKLTKDNRVLTFPIEIMEKSILSELQKPDDSGISICIHTVLEELLQKFLNGELLPNLEK